MLRGFRGALAAFTIGFTCGLSGCTNAKISDRPPSSASADPTHQVAEAASASQPAGIAALIGVDLGAGSGFLIGAAPDRIQRKAGAEARAAAERSRLTPATVADARHADTADLNGDGFITLDEIVAMQKAGFSDGEMIDRIQRSGQQFVLTEQQQDYLRDRAVGQPVVDVMVAMGHGPTTAQAKPNAG
jgi:hypothetical protein